MTAQRIEISGQLLSNEDVEGLHILNKTASKYDISDEMGFFKIPAKVNDTIFVSGLKFELEELIISTTNIANKSIKVVLREKVNALDQVIVGKLFTGSLESDIQNSDAKAPVNFYDLGLPGSTKLPMTQNERKLFDVDSGPIAMIMGGPFGGGMGLNFHKLLNTISGRTKKLKAIVALDDKDKCINRLRRDYEAIIFENDNLPLNLRNEFFMMAQEFPQFWELCRRNNDIEAIDFLKATLIDYKGRINVNGND